MKIYGKFGGCCLSPGVTVEDLFDTVKYGLFYLIQGCQIQDWSKTQIDLTKYPVKPRFSLEKPSQNPNF